MPAAPAYHVSVTAVALSSAVTHHTIRHATRDTHCTYQRPPGCRNMNQTATPAKRLADEDIHSFTSAKKACGTGSFPASGFGPSVKTETNTATESPFSAYAATEFPFIAYKFSNFVIHNMSTGPAPARSSSGITSRGEANTAQSGSTAANAFVDTFRSRTSPLQSSFLSSNLSKSPNVLYTSPYPPLDNAGTTKPLTPNAAIPERGLRRPSLSL